MVLLGYSQNMALDGEWATWSSRRNLNQELGSSRNSLTDLLCDLEQIPNLSDAPKVLVKVERGGFVTYRKFSEPKVSLIPELNFRGSYSMRIW